MNDNNALTSEIHCPAAGGAGDPEFPLPARKNAANDGSARAPRNRHGRHDAGFTFLRDVGCKSGQKLLELAEIDGLREVNVESRFPRAAFILGISADRDEVSAIALELLAQ
jgi:hypothetical protein